MLTARAAIKTPAEDPPVQEVHAITLKNSALRDTPDLCLAFIIERGLPRTGGISLKSLQGLRGGPRRERTLCHRGERFSPEIETFATPYNCAMISVHIIYRYVIQIP